MWAAFCSSERGWWLWFKDGDPIEDATATVDAARVLTSPRCRVENFFQMKDSSGDVGVDVGAGVGVLERDFPREGNIKGETNKW